MKRVVTLVLVVAVLGAAGWWLRERLAGPLTVALHVPTAEAKRQRLTVTLPVHGYLESADVTRVRFDPTSQPRGGGLTVMRRDGRMITFSGSLKIVELCENNAPVETGDLLFQLDTKDLIDQRDELAQSLADAQEALSKAEADAQVTVSQAESGVEEAQEALALAREQTQAEREKAAAQVNFTQGELQRVERELERDRRLAELNYIPGTDLRKTETAWREQKHTLEQQQLAQQNTEAQGAEKMQSAQTALELAQHEFDAARDRAASSVESAQIKLADTQASLDQANAQIAACRVVAPTAGFAVLDTTWQSGERRPWRVGDELRTGQAPVMIYDLEKMHVRCQIGEMDISRVHEGQEAFVLSPSQWGRRYGARVGAVEELAREAEIWSGGTPGKKVFGTLVDLEESDPAHLRPGMSVDVEIVLEDLKNVITVPIRAVFRREGGRVVYRKRGQDFEPVPVTTGSRSDLLMAVGGSIRPGDAVALTRPPASRVLTGGEGR